MIHKIKTVTYEVRSHRQVTVISSEGEILKTDWGIFCIGASCLIRKPLIKGTIWHLQDVLKVLNKLEREKQAAKEAKKQAK